MLQRITEYLPAPVIERQTVSSDGRLTENVTLSGLVRILKRRFAIIAATTLAFVVLAVVALALIKPVYTATATILIDPRRTNIINLDAQQTVQNPATDDATVESQVLLAQSVTALRRVVDQLNLTQDPEFVPQPGLLSAIKALFGVGTRDEPVVQDVATLNSVSILQKRLKVARQRNSYLLDIGVSSQDPQKAAKIADSVASSYFVELIHAKSDATKTAATWLNQQLEDMKSRVLASDKAVEEFRSSHRLNMAQGVTVNDQQIKDLNSKLIEARAEAAETRAKYEQVAQIASNNADPGSLIEALASDTIARLRSQYAELVKNESDLSSRFGPQHPMLAGVRAQVRDTQKLINEEIRRILQGRQHAYEVAAARVDSLRNSLAELQGFSGESGQAEVRLRELQREADANRTLYESFLARYKEATARESLNLPEARLVTGASAPVEPSFPKAFLFVGLALPLGFAFGSLLAIGIDRFDRRVKTIDQLEEVSGLQAITALPLIGIRELSRITKRGRRALAGYRPGAQILPLPLQPPLMRYIVEEPNSLFAEGIRAVRLSVQRAARMRRMQIVMVTSAIEGEGKTTLAANLALSYVMMGIKTLLIEGDLRNPETTRSLCPNADIGLFDVALGRVALRQAILVDPNTSLAVLPCPVADSPELMSEFLFSDGMGIILNELRRNYEMVIIDAPPLVPFVDSRALGELADGIIMTVGWDKTPEQVIERAVGLMAPLKDRILGTVLTRVDLGRLRYYDYYRSLDYIKPYADAGGIKQAANS